MVSRNITYNYSIFFTGFMVIRVYHIIRLVSIMSKYRSSRSQRLCQMNGTYADTFYSIKCMMKEAPLSVMIGMLLSGIFVFGYLLRLFERPAAAYSGRDFSDYGNAM